MQHLSSSETGYSPQHRAKSNHYPTLFFYNIETNSIEWEIFGAEILVDVDSNSNEITYITNEVWYKASKQ